MRVLGVAVGCHSVISGCGVKIQSNAALGVTSARNPELARAVQLHRMYAII